MKRKFLFLYIPAGGWHISTSNSLVKYFQQHYGDQTQSFSVDGFVHANRLLKKIIIDGYKKSQTTGQRVYEFLYRLNKRRVIAKINQVLMSWFLKPEMKRLLRQYQPDHVVILHFFLTRPMVKAIKELHMETKITTIITDPFTIHKLRSLDKKMDYVVFSDRAKKAILERGVPEDQVREYPTILKEEFTHSLPLEKISDLKKKYHIDPSKKVVLVLWWGDGMPKGEKMVKEIINRNLDVQVLVVCGRSHQLYKKISDLQKQHPNFPLTAFGGFIDFVYDLINISDIIITKWWPATLMEILMMGKVPIINSYIREQEKWNVEFVVHNKLGFYETDVSKMITIVENILNGDDISYYQKNIQDLHLRNGTEETAEYLLEK